MDFDKCRLRQAFSSKGSSESALVKMPRGWKSHAVAHFIDFELKKVLLPPLGNFADIFYLEENFKPYLLRDVCTLCSGALVSDSLLHMLL